MNDNKLILSLVIGVIILFGVFMMLTGEDEEPVSVSVSSEVAPVPEPVLPAPVQAEPPAEVAPPVEEPPVELVEEVVTAPEEEVEVQVETEVVQAPEPVLPPLNNSDIFVTTELAELDGGSALLGYLVSEELIRKFVVMVENVSRGEFPERNLPLTGPQTPMQVTELGSEFYLMDGSSYRRFDMLVNALANISTDTAVEFYRQLQPLFRQAYAELGIPDSNFEDVFIRAIDQVLNARSAPQPQQLIRPSLNYQYADPQIENYSDVEKLLLRLGPDNTENLQRRLEFFKRRLQLDQAM